MSRTWVLVACFAAMGTATTRAAAQAAPTADEASADRVLPSLLSADPNGPHSGMEFRGAVRGRISDTLEFVGAYSEPGFRLAVTPFVELHEPEGSHMLLPSQYWRGRMSFDFDYGFERREHLFRAAVVLSHESDHETAHAYSTPGYLALNDIALRFGFDSRHGIWAWHGGAAGRVFVASCTDTSRTCGSHRGGGSIGGQLDFTVAVPGRGTWRVVPYLASSASAIRANGHMHSEARLSLRLGAYTELRRSVFTIYALGFVGNEVGVIRDRTLRAVGVGAGFSR